MKMEESPKWLVASGRFDDAANVLKTNVKGKSCVTR